MAIRLTRKLLARQWTPLRPRQAPSIRFINTNSARLADSCGFASRVNASNLCVYNWWVYGTQVRNFSSSQKCKDEDVPPKKMSIFQRFKHMYKSYWYVLVPVHLATSACWFGGFYYLAKSGIDIVALLESWNFSERITNPLKDSSMGYLAISYALYKIATPLRYTVTLGGTTVTINYLKKWGYLKPVPSTEKLKEMYKVRKETLMFNVKDKTDEFKMKKDQLKDQTGKLITKIKDSKQNVLGGDLSKELKK